MSYRTAFLPQGPPSAQKYRFFSRNATGFWARGKRGQREVPGAPAFSGVFLGRFCGMELQAVFAADQCGSAREPKEW